MANIAARLVKAASRVFIPSSATGWNTYWYVPGKSQLPRLTNQEQITDTSIAAAVLGWIGRNFPSAPVVVDRLVNEDWEEQKLHDLARLIQRPNTFYSGRVMLRATIIEWWIDGNAYWLKYRDSTRRPTGLYWVPYWMMEPKGPNEATPDSFIEYYEYSPYPGAKFKLPPEDVVHFRNGLDQFNPRKGLGQFKSLFREIMTDEEASNFTTALLHNMGVPGIVVSPAKESTEYAPTPDEVKATKTYFEQEFGGGKRGAVAVMSGPVNVSQFGFSPEQLSLEKLRRIPEERISGVTGVAAIVAGLGAGLDRSTFANFAEAREASYEENIIPSQESIAADIDNQLLGEFEPRPELARTRFDISNVRILQEDKNKESDRIVSQFKGGVIQQAEARARLGYDFDKSHEFYAFPINVDLVHADDLDEFVAPTEEPEEPQPAITMQPPAQLPAPGQSTTAQDGQGGAGGSQQGEDTGKAARSRPLGRRARSRAKAAERHTRLLAVIEKRTARLRARFEAQLSAVYDSVGMAAGQAYMVVAGKAEHDDIIDDILEMESMEVALSGALSEFEDEFAKTYGTVGAVVFEEVATYFDTDIPYDGTDEMRRIVETGGKRAALPNIGDGIRSDIRAAISDGIAANENPRVIARRIRAEVGSTARAETIARTEVKYAQNVSTLSAYRKSDVVVGLRAFDNQTGYGDADCTERNGKVYTFEEAEELTAQEHPNGTLSWAPVTERT